jgi:mannan endo-1,4-beta-mannosidase
MQRSLAGRTRPLIPGLQVDYYAGSNFSDYRYTSVVPNVNYDTYNNDPRPTNPASGEWTARYTGKLTAGFTQTYTLYQNCEGGDRLYINGALVIDGWSGHNSENIYTIAMTVGQPINIQVDFYADAIPRDLITLSWSSPSVPKQIIPTTAFKHYD